MGKAMTFVVIAWLSVVLVFSAWMIAQSGRYIHVNYESVQLLLDTRTGTSYIRDRGEYVVFRCGPSDHLCEKGL